MPHRRQSPRNIAARAVSGSPPLRMRSLRSDQTAVVPRPVGANHAQMDQNITVSLIEGADARKFSPRIRYNFFRHCGLQLIFANTFCLFVSFLAGDIFSPHRYWWDAITNPRFLELTYGAVPFQLCPQGKNCRVPCELWSCVHCHGLAETVFPQDDHLRRSLCVTHDGSRTQ